MENRKVSVGFFVVGGLALFGIGMFLIGDRHQAFARHTEYYAEFVNLAGLSNGAKVRVAGMDAGQVIAIDIPDSPSSRFRVKWRIDAKLRGLVCTDSVATVGTEGVVGGTYLSVRPGSPQAREAAALATIPSREPTELSELLERGAGLLNDAQVMLKDVGGKLSGTLDGVKVTVANVNDIAAGLKHGQGTAGMLLRDEALAKQIRQSVIATSASWTSLPSRSSITGREFRTTSSRIYSSRFLQRRAWGKVRESDSILCIGSCAAIAARSRLSPGRDGPVSRCGCR